MCIYYTIYRVTNIVDNFVYIGQHKTSNLNDGYLGSGKRLRNAIRKHGKESFTKEILFIFDNFAEMNNKEIELVTEDFLKTDTYNLVPGGYSKCSHALIGKPSWNKGAQKFSEESKKKMSISASKPKSTGIIYLRAS